MSKQTIMQSFSRLWW